MKKLLTIIILFFSVLSTAQRDTVKVLMLISNPVSVVYGWDVKELKNTIESDSSTVLCCRDYWQHIEYLSEAKRSLNTTKQLVIVWAAKDSFWIRNELVNK